MGEALARSSESAKKRNVLSALRPAMRPTTLLLRRTCLLAQQQQHRLRASLLAAARTVASSSSAALPEEARSLPSPGRSDDGGEEAMPPTLLPPTSPPAPPPAPSAPPLYLDRTVFRRPLNPPAIAFSSPEGRKLFSQALAAGTADSFFDLIAHFSTQDEPAYCGLASLAMVLNALNVDPRRPWKGPWRFYSEALLDCCIPLERVKEDGVSLPQMACLARCNGAVARVVRPPPFASSSSSPDAAARDESSSDATSEESEATKAAVAEAEAEFRRAVLDACRGGPESIVASYSRALVSQTGDGHFSPIGAFNAETDSVLVLDVARFKYSPHWLPLKSLVKAMRPLDKATGLPRGWMGVRAAAAPLSVLFTLEASSGGGEGAAAAAAARVFGETTLPELLRPSPSSSDAEDAASLVSKAAAAAPLAAVAAFVGLRAPSAAAAAETAAAAAALASSSLADGGGATKKQQQQQPYACGAETTATEEASACAIPEAAAALLAELEAWPALRVVREALDKAHPEGASAAAAVNVCAATAAAADAAAAADSSKSKVAGCSARSSAAASVADKSDVAHAATVASWERRDLESFGLLPERLALLLAAAAAAEGDPAPSSPSPPAPWSAEARRLLTPPSGSVLAAEVNYLRAQWRELPALDAASAASAKAAGKGCGCGA